MLTLRIRSRAMALAATMLAAAPLALSPMMATPAHAIIVFDPSNYAQNVLTAARTLEQITNQITSLQNEAQMLINQAKNLASLPYSALQTLQQNVQRTQQLLQQAQGIAFNVQQIDQMFAQKYGNVSMSASNQQMVADARSCQTPYCWAMTKTFVAVGSEARRTAVCTQTGSKLPTRPSVRYISAGCRTSLAGTI